MAPLDRKVYEVDARQLGDVSVKNSVFVWYLFCTKEKDGSSHQQDSLAMMHRLHKKKSQSTEPGTLMHV